MWRFASLDVLAAELPTLVLPPHAWLHASRDAWLARPETKPCHVFEVDDDAVWSEQVRGVLGLDPLVPVDVALELLLLPAPQRAESFVTYTLLYLWK